MREVWNREPRPIVQSLLRGDAIKSTCCRLAIEGDDFRAAAANRLHEGRHIERSRWELRIGSRYCLCNVSEAQAELGKGAKVIGF